MPSRVEHYLRAEALQEEGIVVVKKIGETAIVRQAFVDEVMKAGGPHPTQILQYNQNFDDFTRRMDELGKKAMGIWAQAQIHATLASAPPDVERGARRKKDQNPPKEKTDDERDIQPEPPAGSGESSTDEPREGGQ